MEDKSRTKKQLLAELRELRLRFAELEKSESSRSSREAKGELVGTAIVRDITEHKQREEAIKDSEERLRILFEYAPDAYYLNDLKGNFIDGNRAAEKITGYKREELIGGNFLKLKLLDPQDSLKAASLLAKNLMGKPTEPEEFVLKRKNGTRVPVEIKTFPIKIKGKAVVLGIARDISRRKKAEEKLKLERAYIDQLFESSQEAIVMADKNGQVMRSNDEFISLFGFSSNNEVVGKHVDDLIVPDDLREIAKSITNNVRMGDTVSLETVRQRKDGKLIDVSVLASPIEVGDKLLGVYGIYRDISERKKWEKKLRESAVYLNIMGDVLIVCDPELRVVKVNKAFSNLWGYTPNEVLGKPVFELFKKGELAKHRREMEKAVREGGVRAFETIALTKEKKEIDVSITGTVLKDKKGKLLNFTALFHDITERKHAEKIQSSLYKISEATNKTRNLDDLFNEIHRIVGELMPSENFYIALYDSVDDTVSFPYFVDELQKSLPPRKSGKGLTEYVIRTGKPLLAPFGVFKELKKKGEVELTGDPWIYWLGVPLKIRGKTIGVLTLQSYSEDLKYGEREKNILMFVSTQVAMAIERKRAEEELRTSLKEKEVLLKEIHHRVKNNLQVISSLLLLQSKQIKGKKNIELFKESQNRVKSMALIHEKLYQSQDLASIDFREYLNTLIVGLFRSYQARSGHIDLKLDVDDISLGVDTAIPCGLIINELVSNSLKHAFPNGHEGEVRVALHPINKKDVELVISDNGVGIPKDLDFRQTNSLGLHLVTILAEDQLDGEIKLSRDKGTEFRLKLRGVK